MKVNLVHDFLVFNFFLRNKTYLDFSAGIFFCKQFLSDFLFLKCVRHVLVLISLVCFRLKQFYLKSIQADGLTYCFNLSKNSNKSINFYNFFCKFDSNFFVYEEM